ncbi:hypothetical protein DICVIV_04046 [Dictyocaulus viviparus]|uniref:Uncharacterized protein n=1 Tax=Dictyocaulus viviparus TaxID=29172 RepID=A0A0D8XYT4_DICVI|nr:hypothetical protein DICVIV_04046 [Dictyocaulus viviparus]
MKTPSTSTSKERKFSSRSMSLEKHSNVEAHEEHQPNLHARSNSPRTKVNRQNDLRKNSSKKKVDLETGRLERQATLTIVDKVNVEYPTSIDSSPIKTTDKPKSVVKPMLKDPTLASSVQKSTIRTTPARITKEMKSSVAAKSSIPKSINSAPKKSIPSVRASTRVTVSSTESKTKSGRSSKQNEKPTNSIQA